MFGRAKESVDAVFGRFRVRVRVVVAAVPVDEFVVGN